MSASMSSDFARAMVPIAIEILGEPNRTHSSKDELRWGSRGSFSVDVHKGTWCDHEAGNEGGGVLKFLEQRKRLEKPAALEFLRDRGLLPPAAAPSGKAGAGRIVATYDYFDNDGVLVFQVVRFDPKDFRQRRPDSAGKDGWTWKTAGMQLPLYHLPEVSRAISAGQKVFVAEGEKAVDALRKLGVVATCSPGGAGKWKRHHSASLKGGDVVILPDNDPQAKNDKDGSLRWHEDGRPVLPGQDHAADVAKQLRGVAARVRIVALPGLPLKGDAYDWIEAGGTRDALDALLPDEADFPAPEAPRPEKPRSAARGNGLGEARPGDLDGFRLTEDGVARAFAKKHQEKLRYCHTRKAWYYWTGFLWQLERTALAFSWARALCRELASGESPDSKASIVLAKAATAAAVERFAQSDRAFAVTAETWDQDGWKLGTPTGTVDLKSGQLRAARQADYITKSVAVVPANSPECPIWLEFLEQATGGDAHLIRFLQQWAGYTLTGDTREHALLFIWGPGGNGKSVFLNVLSGIMGDYSKTAAMDTFTATRGEKHPTDLAMLAGARMVSSSETEEGRAWAETRIKQLTGGDVITARFMARDFFEYRPTFKLIIIGNNAPVLRNVDDAARRRFNVVPFDNTPTMPDRSLEDKLRAEWPAILRWMIEGCLDWQKNGLIRPEVVTEATKEYFSDQDTMQQWLDEACEVTTKPPHLADTNLSLFASWRSYAASRGEEAGGSKGFSTALQRRGFRPIRDTDGIRGRGFRGLKVQISHYDPEGR